VMYGRDTGYLIESRESLDVIMGNEAHFKRVQVDLERTQI